MKRMYANNLDMIVTTITIRNDSSQNCSLSNFKNFGQGNVNIKIFMIIYSLHPIYVQYVECWLLNPNLFADNGPTARLAHTAHCTSVLALLLSLSVQYLRKTILLTF